MRPNSPPKKPEPGEASTAHTGFTNWKESPMTETSNTNTAGGTAAYAALRAVLDTAEAAGLPAPSVTFSWHHTYSDEAVRILTTFPDQTFKAFSSGPSEWLSSRTGEGSNLTVFLATPPARPAELANAVLAAAAQEVAR
jgi:hypothetical protein